MRIGIEARKWVLDACLNRKVTALLDRQGKEPTVVCPRLGSNGILSSEQQLLTVALNTFWVWPVEWKAGEELGCHAPAAT